MLVNAHMGKIDIEKLIEHFNELILYDVGEARLKTNIEYFSDQLEEKGLYDG